MKILANPVLLRAAVVFFCASFSFLLGLLFVRLLRKGIKEEAEVSSEAQPGFEAMPMHVYNTVIAQLKQQKNELQAASQAEHQRTKSNLAIAQAIVSNLSTGVLVIGTNGIVKMSNQAAKDILGFAATSGMGVDDIFRGAVIPESMPDVVDDTESEPVWLADVVRSVIAEGGTRRRIDVEYEAPTGANRYLCITISAVADGDPGVNSAVCLIEDASELNQLRGQQSQGFAATSAG
ncbi:MAG TPA: hypothetical protein VKV39_06175 [Candidatus Sulfotelmatobacter sp.]|nr:hypothetical protein [Candidatus Sulfotelmatobacter sp.]